MQTALNEKIEMGEMEDDIIVERSEWTSDGMEKVEVGDRSGSYTGFCLGK